LSTAEKPLAKALYDETYENLDFISKATEPFVMEGWDKVAELPDRIEVPENLILKLAAEMDFRQNAEPRQLMKQMFPGVRSEIPISECFELEIESSDGELSVDAVDGKLVNGKLFLVKVWSASLSNELAAILTREWFQKIYGSVYSPKKERLAELIELFDVPKAKSRSQYSKLSQLIRHVETNLFTTYRVRSLDAALKIAKWLTSALNGDQGALVDLTHFKVRTHSGNPIYSLSEIV
jgi:hypothetical protein